MDNYVLPETARRRLDVSNTTLRKWAKEGKIDYVRIGPAGTHRRYNISALIPPENKPQKKYCYARVSTREQKKDLERQIDRLRSKYPEHEIISDIGSGLNFKRKGFKTILEEAIKGHIDEIVITNKDRLCRFGFELIETILSLTRGKIVVLNQTEYISEKELVDDVISIITVFSAKLYGRRSHRNKRDEG